MIVGGSHTIFRIEEFAEPETSMKQVALLATFLMLVSKMLVDFHQTTQQYISGDRNLHSYCENLTFSFCSFVLILKF
jgi:hypothetical protein